MVGVLIGCDGELFLGFCVLYEVVVEGLFFCEMRRRYLGCFSFWEFS